MKRILMRGGKAPFDVISANRIVSENVLSNNNGNMLFLNSMHKALSAPGVEVVVNKNKIPRPDRAAEINSEYDMLVIPLANAFKTGGERILDQWTNLVRKLNIPCVITGVGAQKSLNDDPLENSKLNTSVKNLVGAVLDKSNTIGVRGEFTKNYLNKLGFSAVEVIGCPSMFTMGGNMNVQKKTEELSSSSRMSFNFTRKMPKNICNFMRNTLDEYVDIHYAPQDIDDLKLMMWGRSFAHFASYDVIPNNIDHPVFRQERALYFTDTPNWFSYMRGMDFSFGTRIHGNIAALLSGTPGFVIAHDSRTLELAEYFDIPHIKGGDINEDTSINDLYRQADYARLNERHLYRFNNFKTFLENNSIDHIYKYEGAADSYQEKLNSVEFFPSISALNNASEAELMLRTLALIGEVNANVPKIKEMEKKIELLEKRIISLQKVLKSKQTQTDTVWASLKNKLG